MAEDDDLKEALFTEHLRYELMFDAAAEFLDSPEFAKLAECAKLETTKLDAWFRYNSAIETFWLHARLLIEFLSDAYKSEDLHGKHASATDFAGKYRYDQDLQWAYDKINKQIAHFNYQRKSEDYCKLQHGDVKAVKGALNKEIKRFMDKLDDHWKKKNETEPVAPNELYLYLGKNPVPSATNQFESVKSVVGGTTTWQGS